MAKATWSPKTVALFSESKLLCFSVFYLSTSLLLALYACLSGTKLLVPSPSLLQPIQKPLFSYPPSYGENKYAIQTLRSDCSSSVFFSDYASVVKEIDDLCKGSSFSSPAEGLRYMQRRSENGGDSFGGNLSARERFSYFDRRNGSSEVACGFFKAFPLTDSDRMAMESCRGVLVVSAIFNDHDKIRQPRGLGPKTVETVCFHMFVDETTLKALENHKLLSRKSGDNNEDHWTIGVWRLVKVSKMEDSNHLYANPAMKGTIPKYLVHRLYPNAKFSVWIDAKLRLVVDPLLLVHSLVVSENFSVAISKNPMFLHTMEEAIATAVWRKWDVDDLRRQMETYCEFGLRPWSNKKLPYTTDVPDSALILRKHDYENNLFSCLLFNELDGFNPRDQLAFAHVRDHMRPKMKINMFEVEVFEQIAMEYRHNLKKTSSETGSANMNRESTRTRRRRRRDDTLFVNSSCLNYLMEMWGETN